MSEEKWRPVPFWENYLASSWGRIWSVARPRGKGGLLSLPIQPRGYRVVTLYRSGERKKEEVHRVVAVTFLGPRPSGMEVRHLDGNPVNNFVSNLRYGTVSENRLDLIRHGGHRNAAKTHCPKGHAYDEENTQRFLGQPNARHCRACQRARSLAIAKVRVVRTHCPRGHPYSEENTRVTQGKRRCRICINAARRLKRVAA